MRNPNKRLVLTIVALAWSTLLLPFAAPLADAAELKQIDKLGVFDANNKKVGEANFQADDDVQVVFEVDKSIFFVRVLRNRFHSDETLYFESTDCSGPVLDDVDDDLVREALIGPPGNTVYLPDPHATPRTYTIRSEFTGEDDDVVCQTVAPNDEVKVPTIPIIDLLTVFTPPFSVDRNKGHNR